MLEGMLKVIILQSVSLSDCHDTVCLHVCHLVVSGLCVCFSFIGQSPGILLPFATYHVSALLVVWTWAGKVPEIATLISAVSQYCK